MTGKILTSTRKLAMSSWGEGPGWGDLWSGSSGAPWGSLWGSKYSGSHHHHHRGGHSLHLHRSLLILTLLPDHQLSQPSPPTRPSSPHPNVSTTFAVATIITDTSILAIVPVKWSLPAKPFSPRSFHYNHHHYFQSCHCQHDHYHLLGNKGG